MQKILPLFIVVLCLSGCAEGNNNHSGPRKLVVNFKYSGPYPIKVACTTGMVADLVGNVGGPELVAIAQLMGHDVDPHTFKATSADVTKLNSADVVFYSGLHLEGQMVDIFANMARRRPTFGVAEFLPLPALTPALSHGERGHDPHVWFDVSLWREAAGVVRDVLKSYDPKNAHVYQARADAYQHELAQLHEEVKTRIAGIPEDRRILVTSHDAFRYFGKAYKIEVRGIQGISTDAEASVKDITDLAQFLVERRVKAVFVESSVNPRNMEALIRECRSRAHTVKIGGELYSDAMGPKGTPAGTYIGMIRHNVRTMVEALQ